MASNTPNLNLYKKDPVKDGEDVFNIETMLNENWDKIDKNAENTSRKNKANGYAGLDANSKLPRANTYNSLSGSGSHITDLDTLFTSGVYPVANNAKGTPISGEFAQVLVHVSSNETHNNANNWIWQMFFGTGGNTYVRRKVNNGAWQPWAPMWTGYNDAALFTNRGLIANNTDLNTLTTNGIYSFYRPSNVTYQNSPNVTFGILFVYKADPSTAYVKQEVIDITNGNIHVRTKTTIWTDWKNMSNADTVDGYHAGSGSTGNTIAVRNPDGILVAMRMFLDAPNGTSPIRTASKTLVENLNADMVDGIHASGFMQTNNQSGSDLNTLVTSGVYRLGSSNANAPTTAYAYAQMLVMRAPGTDTIAQLIIPYNSDDIAYRAGNPPEAGGASGYRPWKRIWTEGNMGAGSGMNADMVDGLHVSAGSAASTIVARDVNQDIFARRGTFNAANGVVPLVITSKTMVPNLNADMVDGKHASDFANLATTPQQTTSDITYYVKPNGSDLNNGLSLGTAFKTIGKAISMIPQIVNHDVTINISAGTYNENLDISGLSGKGTLFLNPAVNTVSTSYNIQSLSISNCSIRVVVRGINALTTETHGFAVGQCIAAELLFCSATTSTDKFHGVSGYNSNLYVYESLFSNKYCAFYMGQNGRLLSWNNKGTGNKVSLYAGEGGQISENGTSPEATYKYNVANGGGISAEVINPWGDNTSGRRSVSFAGAGDSNPQSINTSVWTKVMFPSRFTDQLSEFNNSTFTPKQNGIYSISITLGMDASTAGGITQFRIYKNGNPDFIFATVKNNVMGFEQLGGHITTDLSAGVPLEVYALTTAPGGITLSNSSYHTYITITRVA